MSSPRSEGPTGNKSTPPSSIAAATLAVAAAATPLKASAAAGKVPMPGRGAPGVIRGPYQPRKSRPCLYCGRIFSDKEELRRHEQWEAAEFEQEALDFEMDPAMRNSNNRVNQSDFESQSERFQQLIDRTDEEFGDDNWNGSPPASRAVPRGVVAVPSAYTNGVNSSCTEQHHHHHSHLQQQRSAYNTQYNHTSQYTSLDPGGPAVAVTGEQPPPAHEGDHVAQHGFLPPPPPLPVPQFAAQGCHNRGASDAEFPDPNEERTYTRLTSKDESHTCSSLLEVNSSMSPSREVLDLSLPKSPPDDDDNNMKVEVETGNDQTDQIDDSVGAVAGGAEDTDPGSGAIIKNEIDLGSCHISCSEEDLDTARPDNDVGDDDKQQLMLLAADHDDIVFFEPASVPIMPEANLSTGNITGQLIKKEEEEDSNGLSGEDEWKTTTTTTLNGDYSNLMMDNDDEEDEEEDDDATSQRSSRSPLQFDDPNRLDCKFCGMIFEAPHVRKFHESSHDEEQEEYDGELTRLFCGFCGKTFKKAQYRILHEKGHTGELSICCAYCDRRFRWESELRSHNRIFCTPERPAKPLAGPTKKSVAKGPATAAPAPIEAKTPPRSVPLTNGVKRRVVDQWHTHPSLPAGWRQRSRPRPATEGSGQAYFVYMAPEGQLLHSRRAVLKHMKSVGGYSRDELKRMKLHCKSGPRGRRPKSLLVDAAEEENSNSGDRMDTSGSNLDCTDSSNNMAADLSIDNCVNDDDDGGGGDGHVVEGKRKKSRFSERKLLSKRRVNKA